MYHGLNAATEARTSIEALGCVEALRRVMHVSRCARSASDRAFWVQVAKIIRSESN